VTNTTLSIQSRQEEQSKISANFLRRMDEALSDPDEQRLFRAALKRAGLSWQNVIDQEGIQQPQVDKVIAVLLPDIPDISLRMFARAELADLGVMGYAAINSDTVGRAMDLLYRYHELTSDRYFDTLEIDGDQAVVTPTPRMEHIHEFRNIAEDSLAGNWRTVTLLLGPGVDVSRALVRFGFPAPGYRQTFADVFSCKVEFDALRSELRFPIGWLRQPVASANKTMADVCTAMCERLLGADTSRETPQVVRRLLLSRPGRRMYRLEEAAEALNLTSGQLRKRLYRSGTTYKQIVLDIRMALARHYLEDTALPVQEIAFLLDYSQPAPFSRAFKAYFGVSPELSRQAGATRTKM
jgi:AraC-like DNA-binding protein